MRRIVLIPSGMAGVRVASRLKKKDHSCEVNVILPGSVGSLRSQGPFSSYFAERVPERLPEKLDGRGIGCIEVDELGLDLESTQVIARSKRGELSLRYSDLVMEFEALPRVPRHLRHCENVLHWPCSMFYSDLGALDAALWSDAATESAPLIVIGGGFAALEALGLAMRAAGHQAANGKNLRPLCWVRTKNSGPAPYDPLENDVWNYLLRQLKGLSQLTVVDWSNSLPEQLAFEVLGERLHSVGRGQSSSIGAAEQTVPASSVEAVVGAAFIWADSLMVQHPLAGQAGLEIESNGLLKAGQHGETERTGLYVLGSGVNLRRLHLPLSSVEGGGRGIACPSFIDEAAGEIQGRYLTERLLSGEPGQHLAFWQGLGAQSVSVTEHLHVGRIGLGEAELKNADLDYEYSIALVPWSSRQSGPDAAGLLLRLICAKSSGELLGAQFVSYNIGLEAEAVMSALVTALRAGLSVKELACLEVPGRAGGALRSVAGMLENKLAGGFMSISPDELQASRESGAEFFTLDLRQPHQWRVAHLPDSVNIPLHDLKKRLMTDVPRMMPIVLVCEHSNDSYATACHLASLGASDLYILDGGMSLWPYELNKVPGGTK